MSKTRAEIIEYELEKMRKEKMQRNNSTDVSKSIIAACDGDEEKEKGDFEPKDISNPDIVDFGDLVKKAKDDFEAKDISNLDITDFANLVKKASDCFGGFDKPETKKGSSVIEQSSQTAKFSSITYKDTSSDEYYLFEIISLLSFVIDLHSKEKRGYRRQDSDQRKIDEIKSKIRDIGYQLWENGGESRMSRILDFTRPVMGNQEARLLEMWWNGIGTWMG
jgi:hypothetical protein